MSKKLFVFGDSWPQGSELHPGEKTFGELIANNLGWEFDNRAIPSTSIPHLILQFQEVISNSHYFEFDPIDPETSVMLFFLTSPLRDLIWENGKTRELNPRHPEDLDWYAKYSTDELHIYRTNTTLLALQRMCDFYNVDSYYIWGWDKVDLWPEIDQTNFLHCSAAELFTDCYTGIIELSNSNNKYLASGSHPNQMGHQLIADNLTKFITEKLTHT